MAQSKGDRAPKTKVIKFAVGGFVLILVAITGATAYSDHRAKKDFEAAVAEAKSLGLGTDINHFIKEVPPHQNAALAMAAVLPASPKSELFYDYDQKKITRDQFAHGLATHKAQMAAIATAVELPAWYPDRNWDADVTQILFPEFAHVKSWVKTFCYRAQFYAEEGRQTEAKSDFAVAAKLASYMAQEDTMIGTLVHIACNSIVRASLERYIHKSKHSAESVQTARQTLALLVPADYMRAMAGEAAFQAEGARLITKYSLQDLTGVHPVDKLAAIRLPANPDRLGAYLLTYMNGLGRAHQAHGQDPVAFTAAAKKVPLPKPPAYTGESLWIEVFSPVFDQSYQAVVREHIAQTLALAACDLHDHKRLHGDYPEPTSYTPPLDPWSKKPMHYQKTPQGIVLYSIGTDQADGGGYAPGVKPTDQCYQTLEPDKVAFQGQ